MAIINIPATPAGNAMRLDALEAEVAGLRLALEAKDAETEALWSVIEARSRALDTQARNLRHIGLLLCEAARSAADASTAVS